MGDLGLDPRLKNNFPWGTVQLVGIQLLVSAWVLISVLWDQALHAAPSSARSPLGILFPSLPLPLPLMLSFSLKWVRKSLKNNNNINFAVL